mgnify:CR=1 FL=1
MKLLATSTAIAMACVLSTSALAQDKTLEPVVENATDINESAREAQLTVDKISDSMQERMQQYKQIMKEIEGLQVYTNQLQNQIDERKRVEEEAREIEIRFQQVLEHLQH